MGDERNAGRVDLHIHGAFGVDVLDPAANLDRLAAGLEGRGVAGFLPTLVPVSLPALRAAVTRLSAWIEGRRQGDGRGAMPLGIHFEGPFVSPDRCGALHVEALLDARPPNLPGFFDAVAGAPGRSMVTLAPEIPGAIELARELVRKGFVVSVGHTSASVEVLDAAYEAGARHMTHFANAMAPLHHRAVGPVGWGLLRDGVSIDLIGDLKHLAPEMLQLAFRTKPAGTVSLISDAIPPAGTDVAGPSEWTVWGETLFVDRGEARNRKGALAGSVALLDEMERNLVSIGIGDRAAGLATREAPLRVLGL